MRRKWRARRTVTIGAHTSHVCEHCYQLLIQKATNIGLNLKEPRAGDGGIVSVGREEWEAKWNRDGAGSITRP